MDITKIKSNVTISAVVTRVNGDVEDLGVICSDVICVEDIRKKIDEEE